MIHTINNKTYNTKNKWKQGTHEQNTFIEQTV